MKSVVLPLLLAFTLHLPAGGQEIAHRKADLTVQVQSTSGAPIDGATVEVEMLNHAFRFGCAVEHRIIDPNSNDYDPFTVEKLQEYFNSATYGNIMKWSYYEDRTEEVNLAIAALPQTFNAFDGPDKLRLRGHVTIWGADYQLPAQLKNNQNPSAETVHNLIIDHVEAYHTTYKDAGIDSFDLYNEHFNVPELLVDRIADKNDTAAQAAEVATWFNKAKDADPSANLFINDFNILNDWSGTDNQVKAYKTFIDAVRDAGGLIDGIGLQAHMDHPNIPKAVIVRRLDLLAAPMAPTENHPNGLPGLRIEITELDMAVKNEIHNASWVPWTTPTMEDQVALTDSVITAAFEHPAVDGITIWGLDDLTHWRGNSIMYDNMAEGSTSNNRIPEDPALKETGQLWIDKVKGEWWEDHNGSSSSTGKYVANTFKGTHRVTVTFNGETKEQIVSLTDSGTTTFQFAAEAADATTYDAWIDFIDWGQASSLRDADPDQDGRTNLAEFVDGTDPLADDRAKSPRIIASAPADTSIQYSLRAADTSLAVTIYSSPDMVNWTLYPVAERIYFPSIEDGIATYTIPIPEVEKTTFFQIRISEI
ncbi:endo-1,4-beta-xylanase [Pelagicoccus sp. SDUM812002]|uniref:endo-1,4-beta-xylanase n=1 Tax=Pelagicoccus sp. SDUM812002 TaxID=3041266 RepID=UPI00280DD555|nr:endo-1,4-beta-xylanase [Pelagicoccus sp. SDUM812002]MDQ8187353.1 endo-1,4-beta-xylanase [Pelagicoccus sp. SDUM812002]